MGRGKTSEIGDTRVAANGYHYTKVGTDHECNAPNNGWMLTHHLTAEQLLGRHLRDDEMVQFIEPKFKREPENPEGIRVIKKRSSSLRKRMAILEDRIREDTAELNSIKKQLNLE